MGHFKMGKGKKLKGGEKKWRGKETKEIQKGENRSKKQILSKKLNLVHSWEVNNNNLHAQKKTFENGVEHIHQVAQ
jgi:hypothetical protein